MQDQLIAPLVGALLVIVGVVFLVSHFRTWKKQQNDPTLEDEDRLHYYRRFRRRVQTSALIVLIGVLIPIGDAWPLLRQNASLFALYWLIVLLLAFWIVLQAITDMASTGAHTRVALSRVQRKRRELEEQLEQMRRGRMNGSGSIE